MKSYLSLLVKMSITSAKSGGGKTREFMLCNQGTILGGHWPRKGVWGCAALKTPFFTLLLPLARVPFQAKESVHKTPFWENLEILASTALIFTQIWAHKPPNLEIFSSQAPKFGNFPLTSPPFQRQMSVRKPHTSEIRAAHSYLKKSWVPPPPPGHYFIKVKIFLKSGFKMNWSSYVLVNFLNLEFLLTLMLILFTIS